MNLNPRIALIRNLALGDVILATPILKQIYNDYDGKCNITIYTLKPEVFYNNPMVNNVLDYRVEPLDINNFDKIINLDLAYEKFPKIHIMEAYGNFSHGSFDKILNKKVELYSTADDIAIIQMLRDQVIRSDYVVIHMRRDTWPSRNLTVETWKSIIDLILERTALKIIQVGGPNEIAFDHNQRLVNLLGRLSIFQLKELIENSKFYFGIDSGTLHVAASTEAPIISLFTSAHHELRKPLGRSESSIFLPITPQVECYGCQSGYEPPITGVICNRGDPFSPPCKDAFLIEDVQAAISRLI